MEMAVNLFRLGPIIGLGGIVFALFLYLWVLKCPSGSSDSTGPDGGKLKEISRLIEAGSTTFLKKQYTILLGPISIVSLLLLLIFGQETAICYLLGSAISLLAGLIGMKTATKANGRTAYAAAQSGQSKALTIAFIGGSVMGMSICSLALFGVALCFFWFFNENVESLIGLAVGASSMALFSRVGGGIYTKAADVGADLIGKMEIGLHEDDPRNPATIADHVGDNVGDTVGMSADIFESYIGPILATMMIGTSYPLPHSGAIILPIILSILGLIASMIGILSMGILKNFHPKVALRGAPLIALCLYFFSSYWAVDSFSFAIFPYALGPFYASSIGLLSGIFLGISTEYYTSPRFPAVQAIINAGKAGSATNVISGLSSGLYSCIPPIFIISLTVYFAHLVSGIYGIGIASVGMMATTGVTMAVDAFGPISDNAQGMAKMANLGPKARDITAKLDTFGNLTASFGKGSAIGPAALTALSMFTAFCSSVGLEKINILSSPIVFSLFLGGILPLSCGAYALSSVGRAAQKIVEEARRQFREIPGILEGSNSPDSEKCISIAIESSLREMLLPGILTIITPPLVGHFLGKEALGSMLIGGILIGLILALFMTNSGMAWSNAKKVIEKNLRSEGDFSNIKQSPLFQAAATGDTVGDPFKDTAGPTMNILIKLISIVALLMAPLLK